MCPLLSSSPFVHLQRELNTGLWGEGLCLQDERICSDSSSEVRHEGRLTIPSRRLFLAHIPDQVEVSGFPKSAEASPSQPLSSKVAMIPGTTLFGEKRAIVLTQSTESCGHARLVVRWELKLHFRRTRVQAEANLVGYPSRLASCNPEDGYDLSFLSSERSLSMIFSVRKGLSPRLSAVSWFVPVFNGRNCQLTFPRW